MEAFKIFVFMGLFFTVLVCTKFFPVFSLICGLLSPISVCVMDVKNPFK